MNSLMVNRNISLKKIPKKQLLEVVYLKEIKINKYISKYSKKRTND